MFVRLTSVTGAADVAATVDYVESTARPAAAAMAGNRGVAVLADDAAGKVVVASFWADAEALDASEGAVAKLRESAAEIAGGGEATVEVYEAVVAKRFAMPSAGAVARLLRIEGDPAALDAAIAFWTDEALPQAAQCAGLLSAQLWVDRATGKAVSVTGWAGRADLDAAADSLAALRERALAAVPSGRPVGVEELSLISTTAQLDG